MLILALDTSGAAGSVALVRDGVLLGESTGDPSVTHGRRLPGDIVRLLDRCGESIAGVELYAVCIGPGSFTGLRVGIATVQGLALANARKVVPVTSLEALASTTVWTTAPSPGPAGADDDGMLIGVWVDALRAEVYTALYARAPGLEQGDPIRLVDAPAVAAPADQAARWAGIAGERPLTVTGDGAVRYRAHLDATRARIVEPPPLAATIGTLAARRAQGAVRPHGVQPLYVRRPDAERARERAAD